MAPVDQGEFDQIRPNRFASFTIPHPIDPCSAPLIRIAVLDSPIAAAVVSDHASSSSSLAIASPKRATSSSTPAIMSTAVMVVPIGRETDWLFSTFSGHLQLLLSSSPSFSRLILLGHQPLTHSPVGFTLTQTQIDKNALAMEGVSVKLLPLLQSFCPKEAGENPDIPFVAYEDDVIRSIPIEILSGPVVGDLIVEDVLLLPQFGDGAQEPEPRRRLRFKRMPNLVQTQVRLLNLDSSGFKPDMDSLVQPYLAAMAAGIASAATSLSELSGKPKALCLGVGGGIFLMFLQVKLGFHVVGVEADPVVIDVARRHFSLVEGEDMEVHVRDGFEFIKRLAEDVEESKECFDVIMVDLDAEDPTGGASAPPVNFTQYDVLSALKLVLKKYGALIVNVIPQDQSFYSKFIDSVREIFPEMHQIDVDNGESYVLIASSSSLESNCIDEGAIWIQKLKKAVGEKLVDSIMKI